MSRQTRPSRAGLAAATGAVLLAALCVVAIAAARPTGHPTAVAERRREPFVPRDDGLR